VLRQLFLLLKLFVPCDVADLLLLLLLLLLLQGRVKWTSWPCCSPGWATCTS
jgi:hypothetical protein